VFSSGHYPEHYLFVELLYLYHSRSWPLNTASRLNGLVFCYLHSDSSTYYAAYERSIRKTTHRQMGLLHIRQNGSYQALLLDLYLRTWYLSKSYQLGQGDSYFRIYTNLEASAGIEPT